MKPCVFLGPTLPVTEARQICDAVYLPPVQQGDVYRAAKQHQVIGIIDGYFQQVPSVWHKEILWAMEQGVQVFGSASMGALRAAELCTYGMQGIGKIFEAYRDGVLLPYHDHAFEDDDEVAVVHGPAELDYMAVSEAMVNIRCTLAQAEQQGLIDQNLRDALVHIAKELFYPERCYQTLLQHAAEAGLPAEPLQALAAWLPDGQINQKREDALAMLRVIAKPSETAVPVSYHFEHTTLWEHVIQSAANTSDEQDLLDELRLEEETYHSAKAAALLRLLALDACERQEIQSEREELRQAIRRFRRQQGLHNRQALEQWLSSNRLNTYDLQRLLEEQTRFEKLAATLQPTLAHHILDHLRSTGDYARFAERARNKQNQLAAETLPELDDLASLKLMAWYFQHQLGAQIPDDMDAYAQNLGFTTKADFYRAIQKEFFYRSNG